MIREQISDRLRHLSTHIHPDRRKPVVDGITIDGLSKQDIDEAAIVLADAFRPENFTSTAFGGSGDRSHAGFTALIRAELRTTFAHDQPLFAARDVKTDEIVGVVILYRPRYTVSTVSLLWRLLSQPGDGFNLARAVEPRATKRVLDAHEAPGDIQQDHYTLEYIGVRPDRQGEGIGGALLEAVHAFTDNDPATAGVYLVTAGEYTRDIYASYGYETIDHRIDETVGHDGPLNAWHMRRPHPSNGEHDRR